MISNLKAYLDTLAKESIAEIVPDSPDAEEELKQTYSKIAHFTEPESLDKQWVCFNSHCISNIVIDLNANIVSKTINAFKEHGIHMREITWLSTLTPTGIVPELISADSQTIITRYVGEPVSHENIPLDWEKQAEEILTTLTGYHCSHNDIKCDNIMILDGRLSLVDFGWSTQIDEPIPIEWPQGIGRQHRLGIHHFDDRHAIFEALRSAENNNVDRSIKMSCH